RWCGDCRVAKQFLNKQGISFQEIDIDRDDAAAQQVIDWSGGRRVIPTLLIECSQSSQPVILHNPPLSKLAEILSV
ncbi:MAG: glutaredoxin family protein, partial [Bacteroidota bacterium]